jgi:hypothetical protein
MTRVIPVVKNMNLKILPKLGTISYSATTAFALIAGIIIETLLLRYSSKIRPCVADSLLSQE